MTCHHVITMRLATRKGKSCFSGVAVVSQGGQSFLDGLGHVVADERECVDQLLPNVAQRPGMRPGDFTFRLAPAGLADPDHEPRQ